MLRCPKCGRGHIYIDYDSVTGLYECKGCGKQWFKEGKEK